MNPSAKSVASEFVSFLNKAVTPYHAVEECSHLLKSAGFHELKETDQWKLEPCNKYYITRNKSTIIAFSIGGLFKPGNGVAMVAAHTDSPCLRVKPNSKTSSAGCLQVGVSTYGGGLWRTWFDRDLTVAGRVLVQDDKGHVQQKLAHIEKPIFSIPNLAIHLDREANEKFVFNKEDHLKPILATFVAQQLNEPKLKSPEETVKSECECDPQSHHSILMQILAENIGVKPKQIVDFDLCLIDTQPARIGGVYEEFIYGARLDNLVCTFSSITALIKSCDNDASLRNDNHIRLVACYDNEECGSESAQGAASALTEWTLRRLQNGRSYSTTANENESRDDHNDPCSFERSIAGSFLISADQAHACHPNYKSKYEDCHAPSFHKGVVVKINPNQRYATTTLTAGFLQMVADRASVPLQKFVVRNDSTCGSTVGPILSAKLGLQTVDVGTPQLAMHSIREMACISGVYYAQLLFEKYFEAYNEVLQSFEL